MLSARINPLDVTDRVAVSPRYMQHCSSQSGVFAGKVKQANYQAGSNIPGAEQF
jgi:hypothetical protein